MNLKTFYSTIASLLMTASLLTPQLEARTCSGNSDVVGPFGFVAIRAGFFLLGATAPGTAGTAGGPLIPMPITPPGTGGGTVIGSNTPIGKLVAGLSNRNAFTSVGRIFADGMGSLYTASMPGSQTTDTKFGTYQVSPDCSVTATIGDAFRPQTGSNVGSDPISLEGLISTSGASDEIDLVPTGGKGLGATLRLIKTSQMNACNNGSLNGSYSVLGEGVLAPGTSPGGTTGGGATGTGAFTSGATGGLGTPFSVLGRTVADGSGNLMTDASSTTSPVKRPITGTYTMNADCTGTARLQDGTGGTARNVGFMLLNQGPAKQTLELMFTDPGVVGSGEAKQQWPTCSKTGAVGVNRP
jgi:hypothetical protein